MGKSTPNIEIVRDAYGVPHIFTKTDELAYGLAWAHAEDDFEIIQQAYLAGNALLSDVRAKKVMVLILLSNLLVANVFLTKSIKKRSARNTNWSWRPTVRV